MTAKTILYDDWLGQKLQDPKFRKAYDDLEPAYQVVRLRMMRGLTQEQLAALVGTKQPSIARLESGTLTPNLSFLRRVVEVLGGKLTIRIDFPQDTPAGDAVRTRTDAPLQELGRDKRAAILVPSYVHTSPCRRKNGENFSPRGRRSTICPLAGLHDHHVALVEQLHAIRAPQRQGVLRVAGQLPGDARAIGQAHKHHLALQLL